jgi:hypothetical protein
MQGLLSGLFLSPKYSDLTIVCGAESFAAHRNIVCPRSAYFARACDGSFKEALSREIKLPDREPVLVKKTLEFLYTGDYTSDGREFMSYSNPAGEQQAPAASNNNKAMATAPSEPPQQQQQQQDLLSSASPQPQPEPQPQPQPQQRTTNTNKLGEPAIIPLPCFHVLMYAEADYFQIDRLKALAKKKFQASFMDKPNKQSFQAAVVEAYRSTAEYDRGLKDVVIELTRTNLTALRGGGLLNLMPPVPVALSNELLRSVPEFAVDLCIATLDKMYIVNRQQSSSSSSAAAAAAAAAGLFDFSSVHLGSGGGNSTTNTTTSSSSSSTNTRSSSSTGSLFRTASSTAATSGSPTTAGATATTTSGRGLFGTPTTTIATATATATANNTGRGTTATLFGGGSPAGGGGGGGPFGNIGTTYTPSSSSAAGGAGFLWHS